MKYLLSMLAAGTVIVNSLAEGWNQRTGAVVLNPGVEVVVSDSDAASVANSTSITFREGASLVFTNTTSTIFLNGNFINETSKALVRITGSKPVVINADNSGWTGTNVLEGTSTLIVSNRYGLGTSATPKVKVEKTANLWFGGNGLTNDVPLEIKIGMTGRQLQYDRAYGPFVQHGNISDEYSPKYGDAIFYGSYSCEASSGIPIVDAGKHLHFKGPWKWSGLFRPSGPGSIHVDYRSTGSVSPLHFIMTRMAPIRRRSSFSVSRTD